MNAAAVFIISLVVLSPQFGDFTSATVTPAKATQYAPRPAPAIVTYPGYHLVVRIPKGNFYCPLPKNLGGSYHGTEFYMSKPTSCVRGEATTSTSTISVGYALNAAHQATRDIAGEMCQGGSVGKSSEFSIMGQVAISCEIEDNDSYKEVLVSSYNFDGTPTDEIGTKSDAEVFVSLSTVSGNKNAGKSLLKA